MGRAAQQPVRRIVLDKAGSTGSDGRGLYEFGQQVTETISLSNTLLAAGATGQNCFTSSSGAGAILSVGYNLSSDTTCDGVFTQTGDQNHQNPHLGPLANNGGPTPTLLPGAGSPPNDAIPAGTNGCGVFITSDQRGAPRPING